MEGGIFLILIVLFWLASPVVNCIIASGKGFGAVGWFLLGIIFPWISTIVCLALPDMRRNDKQ